MGKIPNAPTWRAGYPVTADICNQQRDAMNFWALTPRCYAYQATAQSLTSGTYTAITLDSEVYDIVQSGDTPMHDTVTNNTRIYIRTAGKYEISGQVQFVSNATGNRQCSVNLNAAGTWSTGTALAQNIQAPVSGGTSSVTIPKVEAALSEGDYVEIFGYQNSGGSLNTVPGLGITILRVNLTGV